MKRYLDSNEPRIVVPRSYIKNEISLSQQDSYFRSFVVNTSTSSAEGDGVDNMSVEARGSLQVVKTEKNSTEAKIFNNTL